MKLKIPTKLQGELSLRAEERGDQHTSYAQKLYKGNEVIDFTEPELDELRWNLLQIIEIAYEHGNEEPYESEAKAARKVKAQLSTNPTRK